MSTSPSDGSKPPQGPKPKSTGIGAFLKEVIATEQARSQEAVTPGVELPRCARCGAPRESEARKCAYCGTER
ncbi:MAG TPA: hypothetical protein VGK73_03115 [Polyangiaceae bacterium]